MYMNKTMKKKFHKQLVEQRKQLGDCKSKAIHVAGEYKGNHTKGDNPRGMSRIERQKKAGLYIAGVGYLKRITIFKPTNIEVLALKTANPKDKPFQHLSLKGIENFYPRKF